VLVAAGVAGFKEELVLVLVLVPVLVLVLVLVAAAAGAEFTADDPAVDAPLLAAG
jgi:hypothetical protein